MRYHSSAVLFCLLAAQILNPYCPPAAAVPAFIHDLQGSGKTSPLAGAAVSIEGIVIGDFQGRSRLHGFFVQEEAADADTDPLTSEGVFVSSNIPVRVGDRVAVSGTVDEYYGLTRLTGVTELNIAGSAAPLPPAGNLTLPLARADLPERFEGMRVCFPQRLVVNDTYNLGRFGEVALASRRHFVYTETSPPGTAGYADHETALTLDRILLDDGSASKNPDPIAYPGFRLSASHTLRAGAIVSGLCGIMSYAYSDYRILPDSPLHLAAGNSRPAPPPAQRGHLQVAALNAHNYFSTIDNGAAVCGPAGNQACRGADSPAEFRRQRAKVISALTGLRADIVGLIEVENQANDEALADLVDGLNSVFGPGTYRAVATGVIGRDAIKVALLYRPATVAALGRPRILDSSVDSRFNDAGNRPSLAQTFRQRQTGEVLTVVVNHLKSKGSPCAERGDPDVHDGQGDCNATRTAAAKALAAWLASDPTGSGDPDVLLLGDFNSYSREDPLAALERAGYRNLKQLFPAALDYSYVYRGQAGNLNHALASPTLLRQIASAAVWHINADEPPVLDYNLEHRSPEQRASLYAATPFRSSDHDPIVVGLDLGRSAGLLSLLTGTRSGQDEADKPARK